MPLKSNFENLLSKAVKLYFHKKSKEEASQKDLKKDETNCSSFKNKN